MLIKRMPNLFNSEGKLREGLPPKKEEFNPDEEAEHMRRIMTSRNAIMRDAWSVLKQLQGGGSMNAKSIFTRRGRNPTF